VGCGDAESELLPRNDSNPTPTDITGGEDPNDPSQCKSREYVGFENGKLHGGRVVAALGTDRQRIKPFGALSTDYTRVLGNTPASLAGSGATFGQAPARWFEEPQSNAVALQTAYNIAFDGCLTYTQAPAEFGAAPTQQTAEANCGAMARKFWSKTPSPQEIQACADVAVTGSASETQPRRRWAYACASVLTASGFLTY
jgi:hypothetical protein